MAEIAVKTYHRLGTVTVPNRITKRSTINKWDIFHYTYGLLHHPDYREQYQENLKRDLPHIPFAEDFWGFANAGERLADIHINYESQPEYAKLNPIETPGNASRFGCRADEILQRQDASKIQRFSDVRGHSP